MAMSEAWRRAQINSFSPQIPWDLINHSVVAITGSTGLIGSQVVRSIISWSNNHEGDIKLVLPVRNIGKALDLFGNQAMIDYIPWVMGDAFPNTLEGDYFIHAACPTSSNAFLRKPTEVISGIVSSTEAVVDLMKRRRFRRCVYLSTMEVYGDIEGKVTEGRTGSIDTMSPRSSYPEAKRLSECLLSSAAAEFGLSISVLRLAQTFGVGVAQNDGRVFAEFGRYVSEGRDIVLLSDGLKRNSYLSVDDAVAAILHVMVHGATREAYNAANPSTFCSILDMAKLVADVFGEGRISVVFGKDADRSKTFRPGNVLDLDCTKLLDLGWTPHDSLIDMYSAMLASWAEHD